MRALLLLLWVCAAGSLLARRLDESRRRPIDTLALGAALGLAVFAGFGFVLGWAFGLTHATVIGAALLTMAAGLGLGAPLRRLRNTGWTRPGAGALALTIVAALLVIRLADRTLIETETGISTGDRHNFGDLPFHMAIAAGFAWGDNFPPAHPELAGVPLTYPFFTDLISGMILALGGSWRDAFFWPTLILGFSVVVALVRFGEAMTGSRALGRTGAALTFLAGGLGFLSLSDPSSVERWWTSSSALTMDETGIRYANFVTTLFIPQRAILFGWPLLFFALALLVEGQRGDETPGRTGPTQVLRWLRAGIIISLLPLVHAHSFAVGVLCASVLALRVNLATRLSFVKGVLPLAIPAIAFMLTHNSLATGRFFEWQPGFDGGRDHPFRYWLMNAGVFLPLVILGVVRAGSWAQRFLAAPFTALFILANLFRLSPWIWDNMKFLAPAHAGLAPFAAMALGAIWTRGPAGKAAAVLGFCIATLSGALDISKVLLAGDGFGIFNREDLEFAEKIRQATPPSTTILTAPNHNHPVLLSGRRVFLGYEGHLWSQGLDYVDRKPVAQAVFQGQPQNAGVLPGFIRIDAIALTPAERSIIPDPDLLAGFPSFVDSPYRLAAIR